MKRILWYRFTCQMLMRCGNMSTRWSWSLIFQLTLNLYFYVFFSAQWDHQLLACQDHLHYRALKWAFCLSDLRQLVVMRSLAQAEMNLMKALKHTQPLFRRFERLLFLAHHWTVVIIRGHPRLAFCRQTAEALKSAKTVCEHNGYSDVFCHCNVTLYGSAGIKWMLLSPEGPFNINTFLIQLFCPGTAKLHLHFCISPPFSFSVMNEKRLKSILWPPSSTLFFITVHYEAECSVSVFYPQA